MSAKDPFQILADELTLIRKDMDQLQRTSLDRDEASELHRYFMRDIEELRETFSETHEIFRETLMEHRDQIARDATEAATQAAQGAVKDIRAELVTERTNLSEAAGEARREAWRWFGGFWVWLASVGAVGALLGALAMAWIGGTISARDFGDFPGVFCASAGGQVIEQNNGSSFCAVWIKPPPETGS